MRRRMEHVRTMRNKVTPFQAATASGALMGLAQLGQEKERLMNEKKNCAKRIEKIEARLTKIAATEAWLRPAAGLSPLPEPAAKNGNQSRAESSGLPPDFDEVEIMY